MNAKASTRSFVGANVPPTCTVMIAYDDLGAAMHAVDALHLLVSRFGHELRFRSSLWRFDLLVDPKLTCIAAVDAIESDLLIIAAHDAEKLPAPLREWALHWAQRKSGQAAVLVGFLGCSGSRHGGATELGRFLKQITAAAGIDFLLQEIESLPHSSTPPTVRRGPPLLDPLINPCPHDGWGLND
jgi:hypothetical protein